MGEHAFPPTGFAVARLGCSLHKFKKLIGRNYFFSFQFRNIITRYRRIGHNLNVMRQSACLVFNPKIQEAYGKLRCLLSFGRQTRYNGPDLKLFILVGWGRSFVSTGVFFSFAPDFSKLLGAHGSPSSGSL